jgi:glutamine synthetase
MPSPALTQQLERNAVAAEDLAAQIQDAGVEHVYYQFTTLNGRVMAKVVPARHVRRNLERGVQFHGSAIADLATSRHGTLIASGPEAEEFVALPDASTFAVLPWDRTFARVICNLYTRPDRREGAGEPLPTCVRSTLARAHAAFRDRTGLELRSGTEPEMSWLGPDLEVWSQPNVSPA